MEESKKKRQKHQICLLKKRGEKDYGKEISHAAIRNTKIKDLMQVVNPLKERKMIYHKSEMIAPLAARNGSLTRGK